MCSFGYRYYTAKNGGRKEEMDKTVNLFPDSWFFLLFGDERQCYIEKDKKTGNTTENQ
jgi:hypothetical protein